MPIFKTGLKTGTWPSRVEGEVSRAYLDTPWGPWVLWAQGGALVGSWPRAYEPAGGVDPVHHPEEGSALAKGLAWVEDYLQGGNPDPRSLPLAPRFQTPFRRLIWDLVLDIPLSKSQTYGDLAKKAGQVLGRPMSPRAVGGAVGANSLSLLIPCHRVLPAAGGLGGYAWGQDLKAALLAHEGLILRG